MLLLVLVRLLWLVVAAARGPVSHMLNGGLPSGIKFAIGSSYAPYTTVCPQTPLLRKGNNVR